MASEQTNQVQEIDDSLAAMSMDEIAPVITKHQQEKGDEKQKRTRFRCIVYNLERTESQDDVLSYLRHLFSHYMEVEVERVDLAGGSGHPRLADSLEAMVFISCYGNMSPSLTSWPHWLRYQWSNNLVSKGSQIWLEIERGIFDNSAPSEWRNLPAKSELRTSHLSLGAFISPGQYVSHWDTSKEVRESSHTEIITTLEFDTQILNITARYLQASEGKEWKMEFPFSSLRNRVLVHQSGRQSKAGIFFFTNKQAKVYSAKLSTKVSDALLSRKNAGEYRLSSLDDDEDDDFPSYGLEEDLFDDMFSDTDRVNTSLRHWKRDTTFYNCEHSCLGKMNAIHMKLALPANDILHRLEKTGFTMVYGNPETVPYRNTAMELRHRPSWECFENAYALECLLSRGYQVTDQLTERFYSTISNGHKAEDPQVSSILLRLADNIDDGLLFNLEESLEKLLETQTQSAEEETALRHFSMARRLVLTPTTAVFLRPELVIQNRVTRYYGPDRFLRVAVRDEDYQKLTSSSGPDSLAVPLERIRNVLTQGININGRHYQFLAASNSQLREHGFWLYAPDDGGGVEAVRRWMGDLTGERCVATYVSRLGQCFSSTKDTVEVDVEGGMVQRIPDITRNTHCFTDGIGKISQLLADKVSSTLGLHPCPSAFQIRYAGCKGVLAVDPTLATAKICVRRSMEKFKSSHSKLEVIEATHPGPLFMNRQVITIMCGLGVEEEAFLALQEDMLFDLADMLIDERAAIKALSQVSMGISGKLLEGSGLQVTVDHFFRSILMTVYKSQLGELMRRTRILVPPASGRIMMGTVDETGTLEYGQVFVQYSTDLYGHPERRKVKEGDVVVTKNPCFHPGDLRRLSAVDVPGLHHMVDVIVFPARGARPHPDEISGSDLDGDMYFVCWEPSLIPPRLNHSPMDYASKPKIELDHEVNGNDIIKFVTEYIKNDQLGLIANAHLVFSDHEKAGIFDEKCLQLAQMHSDAVDFPKTGYCPNLPLELRPTSYPTFMNKHDKPSYKSNKIIGKLYDQCKALDNANRRSAGVTEGTSRVRPQPGLLLDGFQDFLPSVVELRDLYEDKVRSIMNLYGIETEAEAVSGKLLKCRQKRGALKNEKYEISQIVQARMASLRRHAKSMFYEEFGSEKMTSASSDVRVAILKKASALYYTCYTPRNENAMANESKLLSLPWVFLPLLVRVSQVKAGVIPLDAPLDLKMEPDSVLDNRASQPTMSNTALRKISHSMIQYFSKLEEDVQNTLSEHKGTADKLRSVFMHSGLQVHLTVFGLSTLGLVHQRNDICMTWSATRSADLNWTSSQIQAMLKAQGYETKAAKIREWVPLRAIRPDQKHRTLIFHPDIEAFTGDLAIIRKAINTNPWLLPLLQTILTWAERTNVTKIIAGEKLLIYFLGKLNDVTVLPHPEMVLNQQAAGKMYPTFSLASFRSTDEHKAIVITDSLLAESLMKLLKCGISDLGSKTKQDHSGKRPRGGLSIFFNMLQPAQKALIGKRLLQAYHTVATQSSIADLVGEEVMEDGQLVRVLAKDVWGCIMYAEQYTARRMSQSTGAEVSIRQKYFDTERVVGIVLEAFGDHEALAKVEDAIDVLEKKSSLFVSAASGFYRKQDKDARRIIFEDYSSPAQYVSFSPYTGPRHTQHDAAEIRVPRLQLQGRDVDDVEKRMDYQMFASVMLQEISLLLQDYDPLFHGQLRLIIRFGTIYVMNAKKSTVVLKDFYDEMNKENPVKPRQRGRRGQRGGGRGRGVYPSQNQQTWPMRSSFFPKGVGLSEQLNAALKAMEFVSTEENHFFQASIHSRTTGRRREMQLLLDEDFNFCELWLPSFKWLTVDVRRAPHSDKNPDVRIAVQTRRMLNHSDLKDDTEWKGVLTGKTRVLERTWKGLKAHSDTNNQADFVREKHVTEYRYSGMPSGDNFINSSKIRVTNVTEYTRPDREGLFGEVDRDRLELSLEAPLPEDLRDEDNIRRWTKSVWEVAFNLSSCF